MEATVGGYEEVHLLNKIILSVGALSGIVGAQIKPTPDFPITWNDPVGMLVIAPLTVLMISGFNILISPRGAQRDLPTLGANPLVLSNPLNMILSIGFAFAASGVVAVLLNIFSDDTSLVGPTYFLAGGIGTLIGVRVTTMILRSRFK
jgi:hypothetical protein